MNAEQIKQEQERVRELLKPIEDARRAFFARPVELIPVGQPNHAAMHAALALQPQAESLARAYLALLDAHLALHAQLAQAEEREARLREAARNVMVMASPHFSDGTQLLALRELSDALAQAGKG